MSPLLETSDLTKKFGAVVANDRVSLSVDDGEIRGVIGPNGSGKSTLFNTITGFYKPDGGSVTFDGTDVTGMKPHEIAREGLVRTFQIASPLPELTVRQNMLSVYTPGFRISAEKREKAEETMEFLKIDHIKENEAGEISGGQKKLLELGRALMLEPKVILLDEPTAGVNPALQDEILERLRAMNEQGTTFVIVEHDMRLIDEFVDSVTVLAQGQIIAEGSFQEVKQLPEVRDAYLGSGQSEGVLS
jgi:ABC-type branched-subunit amino acid transport system ATPase component